MNTKSFLTSKTLWGGVVLLFAYTFAMFFQIEVSAEEQADMTQKLVNSADEIAALIGFIMVVWGRVTAKKDLSISSGAPLLLLSAITAASSAPALSAVAITTGVTGTLCLQGCGAPSPRWELKQAEDRYALAVRAITQLRQAGKIDDATYAQAEAVRKRVSGALDDMHDAVLAGDELGADFYLGLVNAAMDEYIAYKIQAENTNGR